MFTRPATYYLLSELCKFIIIVKLILYPSFFHRSLHVTFLTLTHLVYSPCFLIQPYSFHLVTFLLIWPYFTVHQLFSFFGFNWLPSLVLQNSKAQSFSCWWCLYVLSACSVARHADHFLRVHTHCTSDSAPCTLLSLLSLSVMYYLALITLNYSVIEASVTGVWS